MKQLSTERVISEITDRGREGRSFIESRPGIEQTPALIGALAAEAPSHIRSVVCNIMASNPQADYLPALLEALEALSTEDETILRSAADAVGNVAQKFPPADTLMTALGDRLLALLSSRTTPDGAKGALIYALGMLRYSAAGDILIEMLDHARPMVRWNAAEALSHMGNPAALPHLHRRLEKEDNPRSMKTIKLAIGYLTSGSSL